MDIPVVNGQIEVYTVETRKRSATPYPHSEFYTFDQHTAEDYAREHGLLAIRNTFVFEDSEMTADYSDETEG